MLASRSELLGRAGHVSQATPGIPAASPPHVLCRVSHGFCLELLSGLCLPWSLTVLPFPQGVFIHSTNRPLSVWLHSVCWKPCSWSVWNTEAYDSKPSLQKPPSQVCKGWRTCKTTPSCVVGLFESLSLLGQVDVPNAGHSSLCFSTHISYLSVWIYPVAESLLCSSITTCPNQTESKLFLSSSWNFLCIFVFTNLLYPVSPLHPVYLTPATTTPCNRETNVSFSIVS